MTLDGPSVQNAIDVAQQEHPGPLAAEAWEQRARDTLSEGSFGDAYGLAVGGQEGVEEVIRQLAAETDVTLALVGGDFVRELDETWIAASS